MFSFFQIVVVEAQLEGSVPARTVSARGAAARKGRRGRRRRNEKVTERGSKLD